jgi:hypothetical protein
MRTLQLQGFKGLNVAAKLYTQPKYFIGGKNFLIDDDGSVIKSWGSQKIWNGHDLKGVTEIFFHRQVADIFFALGLDSGTDETKLKMYDGSWRVIGSGLFGGDDYIWFHSYKKEPYMFWGDNAAYFDINKEGNEFPDSTNTASDTEAGKLIDTDINFYNEGVTRWMRIHNITDDTYAAILEVEDEHTLVLDTDIMVSGEEYKIVHDGFVDIDQLNRAYFLQEGGSVENYQKIAGFSPVIHFNGLWLAGKDDYRNTVIFSKNFTNIFYDIYTGNLPAINYVSIGGDDSASGATYDEITGMAEWGADIFVLKKYSCHRIIGQSSPYRSIPVNANIGCEHGNSIQSTKIGIIFLSNKRDGFWLYNGQLANISKPLIDDFLKDIEEYYYVRSGYLMNRYYVCSLGFRTLVFDTDTKAWSIIEKSYNGFAESGQYSIGVSNKYSETTTIIEDPERPGEDQEVLVITPTETDLVAFDKSNAYELDTDGTGGEELAFEVQTPYFDMGDKGHQKVFEDLMLIVKAGEPLITIDVDVDGNVYEDIRGAIEPRPLYNQSKYYKTEYGKIPFYEARYKLPIDATGYAISLTVKASSKVEFKLISAMIYYRITGIKSEEKEP